jgi:hypothetical protein
VGAGALGQFVFVLELLGPSTYGAPDKPGDNLMSKSLGNEKVAPYCLPPCPKRPTSVWTRLHRRASSLASPAAQVAAPGASAAPRLNCGSARLSPTECRRRTDTNSASYVRSTACCRWS